MGVNAQMADHPLEVDLRLTQRPPGRSHSRAPALSILGWRSVDVRSELRSLEWLERAWIKRAGATRMFSSLLRPYFRSGDGKGDGVPVENGTKYSARPKQEHVAHELNDRLGPFLARACTVTGMDAALPMNSGAEAVETAIKAARKWAYRVKGVRSDRAEIIAAEGNFHGRTISIVGFSSIAQYRDGFGPFPPGFKLVPFGDTAALATAIIVAGTVWVNCYFIQELAAPFGGSRDSGIAREGGCTI
jgi:Aminotransferase class-III